MGSSLDLGVAAHALCWSMDFFAATVISSRSFEALIQPVAEASAIFSTLPAFLRRFFHSNAMLRRCDAAFYSIALPEIQ